MVDNNTLLIVLPSSEDVDKVRGYRITKWHHYDNYECIYCQYATLWIGKMEKHQAVDDHPWAYPVSPSESETEVDNEPSYG